MKIAVLNDDGTVVTFNNAASLELEGKTGEAKFDFFLDDEGVQYQLHQRRPGKALADYFAPHVKEAGTPIDPDRIRTGDLYRAEYDYVYNNRIQVIMAGAPPRESLVRRHTVEQIKGEGSPEPHRFSGDSIRNVRYFLIERANPELSEEAEFLENCMRGMEGIDPERTSAIAYQFVAMGWRMGGES